MLAKVLTLFRKVSRAPLSITISSICGCFCIRLQGWTTKICPLSLGQTKFQLKIPRLHLGASYSTLHSHSTNMLHRSFNQFRIHWSCSLPSQQLKMRSEFWISGLLPQVFPYHSLSHQLSSSNPFSLPDVMTYPSEMVWRDSWRSNFIMSISTGGVFICTVIPVFGCSPI